MKPPTRGGSERRRRSGAMDASGPAAGSLLLPPSPAFPGSSRAPFLSQDKPEAGSPGRRRFCKAAAAVAHLCGLTLRGKRYIEQSPVVQWATFQLQMQMNIRSDLLFNVRDFSKENMQACLKTNRAFHSLPSSTKQKLCQAFIYQKYVAGTIIMKQGHVATECYLLLSGKLKVMMTDENFKNEIFTSEALCEVEEDFIGETCLLTNIRRPASVICKSDTELVVIDKEVFECALANIRYEQYHATCCFLRKLPLFSTWPPGKIDFIAHCSLQRLYRAGTTIVMDSLNSYFIVIVKSGRCTEAARLDPRTISTENATWKVTPRCKFEKQGPQVASLAPRLLKIRTLEQSDIFGLANLMDKLCVLQLSLISEGAECIFIPKRLFLEEATAKSRQTALQMLSSYPTESMIQESYIIQQAWSRCKTKLIGQHLKWHAKHQK
ncbi:cGMP-dependent protein kinase-like isoform 2-T2 [Liasis olivaceus]